MTFRKIKEPAFAILFAIALFLGYLASEADPLVAQVKGSTIAELMIAEGQSGTTILTSTLFSFVLTVIVAIFAGCTDIPRDIDTGLIMLIMCKPVKKIEYLIGKYLGILMLCAVCFTLCQLSCYISHFFKSGEFYGFVHTIRQIYMLMAIFPLVGLVILMSCFLGDFSAMIVTTVYLLFAVFISTLPLLVAFLGNATDDIKVQMVLIIFYTLYYMFPNFIYYFQNCQLIGIVPLAMLVYSVSITVIFLLMAKLRLESRDFV